MDFKNLLRMIKKDVGKHPFPILTDKEITYVLDEGLKKIRERMIKEYFKENKIWQTRRKSLH